MISNDDQPLAPDQTKRRSWRSWVKVILLPICLALLWLGLQKVQHLQAELDNRAPLTRDEWFTVSQLASQYTRGFAQTRTWPKPEEIVKEIPLIDSRRDATSPMRVDRYQTGEPGVMIVFKLYDDGALFFRVED